MATVEENRRINLRQLVKDAGGNVKLAEATGYSEAQISQWLNASKDSRTGKPRGMRPETCRRIEAAMRKEPGWMDTEHALGSTPASSPAVALAVAFDALPEKFSDGGTRLQLLAKLIGIIQERQHLEASLQSGAPMKPQARTPKKRAGRAHAR